jgi:hypothetical protein
VTMKAELEKGVREGASREAAGRLRMLRCGLAGGVVSLVFYGGCLMTMATVSRDRAVMFFNSLLHGLDLGPIIRTSVPVGEVLLGAGSIFVLGWFAGAFFAIVHNLAWHE